MTSKPAHENPSTPSAAEVRAEDLRRLFPIFQKEPDLVYLDNAASTQKPATVIERITRFYSHEYSNVHRGIYDLSEQATEAYEKTRAMIAQFLGGVSPQEIIYTRGTTESINLVASSWGEYNLKAGDEVLLSVAEHHANLVPWQLLAEKTGALLRFIPLREDYRLDLDAASRLLSPKTKLVAITHASNVLGIVNPIKELCARAHAVGAIVLVDGAQAVAHIPANIPDLGCDFYAFSGHKICGPTGIGVLWGRKALLEDMHPYQGGGSMISHVTLERSTWNEVPYKFEAGTPNIVGAIGLGEAVTFLSQLPRAELLAHEVALGKRAVQGLAAHRDIKSYVQLGAQGENDWLGIVTFSHADVHPHDLAATASKYNVCVRAGHHCAHPLMKKLGVPSSVRVSPFLYNTESDIDQFLAAIEHAEARYSRNVVAPLKVAKETGSKGERP